ncbi:MAG: helix-turn-helix domain-containing protein [Hyphomicrobiales bacterium]
MDLLISKRMSTARKISGMSYRELETISGVSKSQLNKIENGEQNNPGIEIIMKIASALQCDVSDFVGDPRPEYSMHIRRIHELEDELARKKRECRILYESVAALKSAVEGAYAKSWNPLIGGE